MKSIKKSCSIFSTDSVLFLSLILLCYINVAVGHLDCEAQKHHLKQTNTTNQQLSLPAQLNLSFQLCSSSEIKS